MKKIIKSMRRGLMRVPFYDGMMVPYHYVRAGGSAARKRFPARKMRVIGVTGTNGKTTTCFMIWKMLRTAGFSAGVMTTVGWGADIIHKQVEHMTTESAEVLNARMRELADAGVEILVLEVTSHALAQGRILGVPIEVAVMTNVTHEHLDYHKTFDKYVKAKCKLFKRARFGVVNADDGSAEEFLKALGIVGRGAGVVEGAQNGYVDGQSGCADSQSGSTSGDFYGKNYALYGIKNGDFVAKKLKLGISGVNYAFCDIKSGEQFLIKTRIPGKFNVYNSLAAACVGRYFKLSDEQIAEGIHALSEVEGRMNLVEEGQDFKVLVDYAHTPDAIEKVFEAMGEGGKKQGRIIVVHGGAGRRDESTRRMRGEIIGRNADVFIVTEDDTRDEDLNEICAEFLRGAESAGMEIVEREKAGTSRVSKGDSAYVGVNKGKKWATMVPDRREAIFMAVKMAKAGDVVMILGKGHEKTILRSGGAEPFEDLAMAREAIRGRK